MPKTQNVKKRTKTVKKGNTILLQVTARLTDGKIVSSTLDKEPLKLTLGKDNIHQSVAVRVVGMTEGESQIIKINYQKAFGTRKKKLIYRINKDKFKSGEPKIGDFFKIKSKGEGYQIARITSVNDSEVIIDANHIYAGEDIICEIELVKILN